MWTNYLTVGFRSLARSKGSSIINVLGMALGLASCILCYLHIQYETGYDSFHEKGSRIYRAVTGDISTPDAWVKIAAPIPAVLKSRIPEIEMLARFSSVSYSPKVVVETEGKFFSESAFMMTDPDFFQIFSFPLVNGNPDNALAGLASVVLTESTARKLFGAEDPMGKTITLRDSKLDFQVTGIARDLPAQSHLRFDFLISFENLDRILGKGRSTAWGEFNYFNYFLLHEGADQAATEAKIHEVVVPHYNGEDKPLTQVNLQLLKNIHFQQNRGNMLPTYDRKYVYIFSAVALALLSITCINYINLAIALSIRRVKEIGVRKAVGAGKVQLTFQFMSESFLTILFALALGLVLLELTLPFVNQLLESEIKTNYGDVVFQAALTSIVLLVGLISGSYLSLYANSYKTSDILKGTPRHQGGGFSLQHMLVLAQFSISLILIICSFVVSDQLRHMQTANIGLNHDQILNVSLYPNSANTPVQVLKEELKKNPAVLQVAASSFEPGRANWFQTMWWEGQTDPVSFYVMTADRDFIATMGMTLAEGSTERVANADPARNQYLINESALKFIGWDHAEGKFFSPFGEKQKQPISGVVHDFNFKSLHHAMDPLVIVINDERAHNRLSIRINSGNMTDALTSVQATFKEFMPGVPFEYEFLDDAFAALYKAESRLAQIMFWLTLLSVTFSLVGLYGIISFNIENRTKEIAIRKALGISMGNLLLLFSRSYFTLLALSCLVAAPICWYLLQSWLENFSYQVILHPKWFALSIGLIAASLSILVGIKSKSLSKINPAVALKCE